jgi:transcriptional regulator with XRE-family HTH domain
MPLREDSLGYRIRRARMWRGVGQSELARAIGISPNAMNSIERGHTKAPNSDILQAIARTLQVSADFLLCLSEKMERASEDDDPVPGASAETSTESPTRRRTRGGRRGTSPGAVPTPGDETASGEAHEPRPTSSYTASVDLGEFLVEMDNIAKALVAVEGEQSQ